MPQSAAQKAIFCSKKQEMGSTLIDWIKRQSLLEDFSFFILFSIAAEVLQKP